MAKRRQLRRGTKAQNDAFTGAVGELSVDTDKKTIRVHDGSTVGGTEIARMSDIPTIPDVSGFLEKSGGTMTGAITGQGASFTSLTVSGNTVDSINASGSDYVRYESGHQVCWGWVDINNSTSTTITYPVQFLAGSGSDYKYSISCAVNTRLNFYLTPSVNGKTASAMTSSSTTQRMWWIATGLWK